MYALYYMEAQLKWEFLLKADYLLQILILTGPPCIYNDLVLEFIKPLCTVHTSMSR